MPAVRAPRALLVHWNHDEAKQRAERLREAGFRAETFSESGGVGIRRIRDDPPDVLVIDLSRLPSHAHALFADAADRPTHAAKQLPNGRWTSKLGRSQDVEHTLEGLEGSAYGRARLVMRRPV